MPRFSAALWATACVGLAIGAGFYACAIAGTVIIFMTTALLTIFEVKQKRDIGVYIEIKNADQCNAVLDEMKKICPLMHGTDITVPKSGIDGHVGIVTNIPTQTKYNSEEIIADLRQIDCIVMAICE